MTEARGKIQHRARAAQLRDFSGLCFNGTWTPTDVDCLLEIRDKIYIFGELKSGDTPLSYGQQTALTRIVDALSETGRHSLLIIARHDSPVWEDIDCAGALVEKMRFQKRWYPGRGATVYEIMSRFLARYWESDAYTGLHGENAGQGDTSSGGDAETPSKGLQDA